ncbi:leucine-rich repeat extensin-like protein 2 [Rutidosis leptorrhynchoides]|uniref:leucine-rich repeat extensin-like protein 2 n=1 Tax=Rutidosis leptorrhynchoides TaxID=125765 RepID=UPI003A995E9A
MKKSKLFSLSILFFLHAVQSGINGGNGGRTTGKGPNSSSPSSSSNAYIALQAWKSAIKDDPNGILNSWVGSNVCEYKGVFCAGNVVAGIDLNHGGLEGILVKELSLLKDMSLLHLNSNKFTGTIPDSLRDLLALSELDLSNNQFSGPFPNVILQIQNLVYLDLRFNLFSGPIPDLVFNKNLDAILLNNNNFEGEIPQSLGNSPASVINLANNKLTGDIPLSFGYVSPRLKEILFLNNQLTGCIPQGIGLWSDLQVFDASFNSLMGHLPDSVSCLEDIEVLNVAHNKLSGELPDLVCELKNLLNLSVAYNFFSGFSQECAKLYGRNVGFDFALNCIPGREMQRPEPDCDMVPGGSLSCLRIPSLKSLTCGELLGSFKSSNP